MTKKINNAKRPIKNNVKKSKKGIFIRLSKYVLRQWPLFILALLLTLGSNQLSLLGPKYSGAAIAAIELSSGVDFSTVWKNVGLMPATSYRQYFPTYCPWL